MTTGNVTPEHVHVRVIGLYSVDFCFGIARVEPQGCKTDVGASINDDRRSPRRKYCLVAFGELFILAPLPRFIFPLDENLKKDSRIA